MVPGTTLVTPSVLVMVRVAEGVRVSVSVAELATPPVGVRLTVFDRVPVAEAEIVPVIVKTTEEPLGRLTKFADMLPVPELVEAVAPPMTATDQESLVMSPGVGSLTEPVAVETDVFERTTL